MESLLCCEFAWSGVTTEKFGSVPLAASVIT
jgi:hypothetical protein